MTSLDRHLNNIDINRARRVRELVAIQRLYSINEDDLFGIGSKSVVVLAYAHWEGFYNDCVATYISFLQEVGGKIRDRDWMMLSGAFYAELQSLRDRNHSFESVLSFISKMRAMLDCTYQSFKTEFIRSKSNLDFKRLSECCTILNFEISEFQPHRNRIDKELVLWRHLVAHGDQPDLTELDISRHIAFTSELLLLISDKFQNAMLNRMPS